VVEVVGARCGAEEVQVEAFDIAPQLESWINDLTICPSQTEYCHFMFPYRTAMA
jgi:hypothetical protein